MLITRRQTTYWDFAESSRTVRVHFLGKAEWRFVSSDVSGFEIVESHPVLMHYQSPYERIYVTSPTSEPSELYDALAAQIAEAVRPWRDAREFFNEMADPVDVLRTGYGFLMHGPTQLLAPARELLKCSGVTTHYESYDRNSEGMKALVAGENYVLSSGFRVEAL